MWEAMLIGWKALYFHNTDNNLSYSQSFTSIYFLKPLLATMLSIVLFLYLTIILV